MAKTNTLEEALSTCVLRRYFTKYGQDTRVHACKRKYRKFHDQMNGLEAIPTTKNSSSSPSLLFKALTLPQYFFFHN